MIRTLAVKCPRCGTQINVIRSVEMYDGQEGGLNEPRDKNLTRKQDKEKLKTVPIEVCD